MATFSSGGAYAWSSPAIPRMNGQMDPEDNPLPHIISSTEESWLASLLPLGAAISTFASGYASDKIGRKNALLICYCVPAIIGFALLTFGGTILQFLIGRFLCGLGAGSLFTVTPIYVAEIAQSNNRGALGCLFSTFLTFGNLVFLLISPYITLPTLGAINLVFPILFAVLFFIFIPDSPYYHIAKNDIHKAKSSLQKFRYNNIEIVKKELPNIVKSVEDSLSKKARIKDIFKDKVVMKAFWVAFGLVCFQQWSGINAIFFYMQSIFEAAESNIPADVCTMIVGVVQFLSSASTLPMADKFGRRFLLLTSSIGCGITLLISGIYFYLIESTSTDVTSVNWLPVLALNIFIASYSIGLGPITFTMIGELFPPHVKALAATVSIFICQLSTFCVTNIFPYLKDSIGMGFTMCSYAVICIISCVFVYLKVPETKGKSLQDIQNLLI